MTNTLLNKTVKELRVIAKDLGLVGTSKLKKEPLISAITNAQKEDIKDMAKTLKQNWDKTSGAYGLVEIERALKVLNLELNMNINEDARFDLGDKIRVIKADGNPAKVNVGVMFQAVAKKNPESRQQQEEVKKEVVVTTVKELTPSEREALIEKHNNKVKFITDYAIKRNSEKQLEAREFNKIYNEICTTFVEMRNTDLSDMWLVNECKEKAKFTYSPDSIDAKFSLFIALTNASNKLTSEYIREIIVNNFSQEKEVMEQEFDVRRNGKRPTEFIRFAELLEEDYTIADYLEDGNQFFTVEGVVKVVMNIIKENIINKSKSLFEYGLNLSDEKAKPVSDKMKAWLRKVMLGYKLTEKEDFPYSEENVFKNSVTAFAINYRYSEYGMKVITENQTKAYLKIAGRYDILGDEPKFNYFFNRMAQTYSFEEFRTIINIYANNKRLVALAINYDEKFNGKIGEACVYISQLNPMEVARMTSRLERIESKHLLSLHQTSDDK